MILDDYIFRHRIRAIPVSQKNVSKVLQFAKTMSNVVIENDPLLITFNCKARKFMKYYAYETDYIIDVNGRLDVLPEEAFLDKCTVLSQKDKTYLYSKDIKACQITKDTAEDLSELPKSWWNRKYQYFHIFSNPTGRDGEALVGFIGDYVAFDEEMGKYYIIPEKKFLASHELDKKAKNNKSGSNK